MINTAYRVGQYFERANYPRDIIAQFPNWQTSPRLLEKFLDKPSLEIKWIPILCPDLNGITITKRRNLKILTSVSIH